MVCQKLKTISRLTATLEGGSSTDVVRVLCSDCQDTESCPALSWDHYDAVSDLRGQQRPSSVLLPLSPGRQNHVPDHSVRTNRRR